MDILQELGYAGQEYDHLPLDEAQSVDVVLSAYRSFRGNRRKHVAYIGVPVTSGKLLYDVLSEAHVRTTQEFIAKFGKHTFFEKVISPNIQQGTRLADTLGISSDFLCIAPSVFEAKPFGWSQDAYLSLWYRVIGELAGKHYVKDGWEYSLGAVKEVFFSMLLQWRLIRPHTWEQAQNAFGLTNFHTDLPPEKVREEYEAMAQIRVYGEDGNEIPVDAALEKCVAAIDDLMARGFPYRDLFGVTWRIMQVPILSAGQVGWKEYPYEFATSKRYRDSRQRLKEIAGD